MRLVVTSTHRFRRSPDGRVWTTASYNYQFWARYLDVFSRVLVVARIQEVDLPSDSWLEASGPRIEFHAVPYYQGPRQYLLSRYKVGASLTEAIWDGDAVIFRGAGPLAVRMSKKLRKEGRPFGLEVIGDPYDVYAPGSVRHPLRPFFRWVFTRDLRNLAALAVAVAYVTRSALQERYPASDIAFETHYSSIDLPDSAFVSHPRTFRGESRATSCVFVGTLEQLYKAPDVLIKAVAECVERGVDISLTIIGGGRHAAALQALSAALGLSDDRVTFMGQVMSGDSVRRVLDASDLFILPSHQEGLPRAMIEAMARGLPCIGTNVGGIPELIPDDDRVVPNEVHTLADKIIEVANDPQRMTAMAARNLEVAGQYRADALRERRREMYSHLRKVTEDWLRTRNQ